MTLLHQAAQKAVEQFKRLSDGRGGIAHFARTTEQAGTVRELIAALESALQQQPEPVAPFWYAVVSDEAPTINKAIRRADAAEEYAQNCRENGYTRVRVVPLYAASPSTTRQQEVGIANGELSKPMPTLLAQRIVGALECGALWAEGSEAHPRILKTLADFNTWIVRQDAVSALSDEEIAMIARGMPMPPWGIGSRREDAIAFARKVLAAAPSTPEKAGGVSDGVAPSQEGRP